MRKEQNIKGEVTITSNTCMWAHRTKGKQAKEMLHVEKLKSPNEKIPIPGIRRGASAHVYGARGQHLSLNLSSRVINLYQPRTGVDSWAHASAGFTCILTV